MPENQALTRSEIVAIINEALRMNNLQELLDPAIKSPRPIPIPNEDVFRIESVDYVDGETNPD